ncbi:preprotein translocase subunit YajC [Microbacterium sp. M28]|uniref:preprotein translocase subunit YajC n=1 Tax=Microbacterium sp. M28 TaxID=2962064 RepID=UPI0021F44B0C|nr:preprotein translocase subunit YajC [Microbacterium sp. M28]UYO98607.1 preprotein translocase subunit YajC [Microbacterium sp. M28]
MEIMLFGLLAVLLIFMVINTRKRNKQMKAEQEEKAQKTIPGAKVLLQGGLYGTVVSFDPENLDQPAQIELAPGAVVEVHSQAILRVVEPTEDIEDDSEIDEDVAHVATDESADAAVADDAAYGVETPEQTRARLEGDTDGK